MPQEELAVSGDAHQEAITATESSSQNIGLWERGVLFTSGVVIAVTQMTDAFTTVLGLRAADMLGLGIQEANNKMDFVLSHSGDLGFIFLKALAGMTLVHYAWRMYSNPKGVLIDTPWLRDLVPERWQNVKPIYAKSAALVASAALAGQFAWVTAHNLGIIETAVRMVSNQ